MKNLAIAIATLLISGFATAQSMGIEGNWGTRQSDNGFTFDITFSISQTSTTMTNVCSGPGGTAVAQITVASSYNAFDYRFNEGKQAQSSNGGVNCNVSVQPDTMHYSVQGNTLVLTHDGYAEQIVLMRK